MEDGARRGRADGPRRRATRRYAWTFADRRHRRRVRGTRRSSSSARYRPAAADPERDGAARGRRAPAVGDEFTLWSSTQIPHVLRVMLAAGHRHPRAQASGSSPRTSAAASAPSSRSTPRRSLALLLTRRLGRPVKWTESRTEGNLTVHHGRDQIQRHRASRPTATARIRGLKVDLLADMGAYLMLVTPGIPLLGAFMYQRHLQDGRLRRSRAPASSRPRRRPTPTAAPAGRRRRSPSSGSWTSWPPSCGMDPMELRRRNWIKHDEFPYTTIAGLDLRLRQLRGGDRPGAGALRLRRAARRAGRPARAGRPGPARHRHLDLHRDVRAGAVPGARRARATAPAAGSTPPSGCCRPARSRSSPAPSPHGQGHETGVEPDRGRRARRAVRGHRGAARRHADRRRRAWTPTARARWRSAASRCYNACAQGDRQGQADRRAPAGGQRGRHRVRGRRVHGDGRPRAGDARSRRSRCATFAAHDLPDGVEPSLDADATFDPENFSFPHGTHLCAIEVDTETGCVTIRSYVAVDDVGKVVNPLIVDGQVHGGVAQGIAQALYEEAVYDADGNLLDDDSWPTICCRRRPTCRPSSPTAPRPRRRPTRSASRASARPARSPSTPAVVNAIVDALRPLGVSDVTMPCTPERVWRAIRSGADARAGASPRPATEVRHDPGHVRLRRGRPRVDEAVQALAGGGEDAKVLAGGQSLLPLLRLRLADPDLLVDLGRLAELRGVTRRRRRRWSSAP